jgi:hypothetical protein
MTIDKQIIAEVDRQLADPRFNPGPAKGLKRGESKATLVTKPDGSSAMLWGHAGWRQALSFARKRMTTLTSENDGDGFTFQHAIIIGDTREVVRTVGQKQRLHFVEGTGFEMVDAEG